MNRDGETTIVARFGYRHEGELAKGFLDDAGIDSMLYVDDALGIEAGMAFVNKARLVVHNDDADRAREVLQTAGIKTE